MADEDRSEKPVAPRSATTPESRSATSEIAAFLKAAERTGPGGRRGRLIFALDATMSRQATWDRAQHLQAEMFEAAAGVGGLDVQLVYFRGFNECRASRFVPDPRALAALMARIDCRGGRTQIGRVLGHALATSREARVDALVYVGDAMEEEADALAATAGELALLGTRIFLFQEGRDLAAGRVFTDIAGLTKGAHVRLDAGSGRQLADLLKAVGAFAAGGMAALEALADEEGARQLLAAMK